MIEPATAAAMSRAGRRALAVGGSAGRFYPCLPPIYDGQPHPTKVRDWLHRVEYMLRACDIDRSEWVVLAASLLEGTAVTFWEAVDDDEIGRMEWEDFRTMMYQQFLPQVMPDDPGGQPWYGAGGGAYMDPVVSYSQAREFIVRVGSIYMAPDESVTSYFGRVITQVFLHNTLFRLTELEQCGIMWNGLSDELRARIMPRTDESLVDFMANVRGCERQLLRERAAEERERAEMEVKRANCAARKDKEIVVDDGSTETARQDYPLPHIQILKNDAEASSSQQHPRPEIEPEDEPAPVRRRYSYMETIFEENEDEEEEDPEEHLDLEGDEELTPPEDSVFPPTP